MTENIYIMMYKCIRNVYYLLPRTLFVHWSVLPNFKYSFYLFRL